jgi:predicted metal-dependent hydrolase
MSVVKSKRGESAMEFIDTARRLEEHTLSCCIKAPKRYREFLTRDIMRLASAVHNCVIAANSVYVSTKRDAELRREYLTRANSNLQALNPKLSLLYSAMTTHNPDRRWIHNAMKVWGELMTREAQLISAVKSADSKRYSDIPP